MLLTFGLGREPWYLLLLGWGSNAYLPLMLARCSQPPPETSVLANKAEASILPPGVLLSFMPALHPQPRAAYLLHLARPMAPYAEAGTRAQATTT